jgi:predicted anti-sigma-YlaC factor YlaD
MRIPEVTAMMNRAYELDPDWGGGTLDEFWLLYYGSLPDGMGGDRAKAEEHYQLALQKAKGLSAGPYVSYAKAMCIPVQDYETYKKCLEAALAIDTENQKENRLVNIINQRKARWLLDNADVFFADTGEDFGYDDEEGDDW